MESFVQLPFQCIVSVYYVILLFNFSLEFFIRLVQRLNTTSMVCLLIFCLFVFDMVRQFFPSCFHALYFKSKFILYYRPMISNVWNFGDPLLLTVSASLCVFNLLSFLCSRYLLEINLGTLKTCFSEYSFREIFLCFCGTQGETHPHHLQFIFVSGLSE